MLFRSGLEEAIPILERMSRVSGLPLSVFANAGIPVSRGGKTIYPQSAEDYVRLLPDLAPFNIRVIGGCCGTTPDYIRELKKISREEAGLFSKKASNKEKKAGRKALSLAGNREYLFLEERAPVYVIGEKINPTGRKDIKKALREENWAYLRKLAREQVEAGAGLIDVNICLPVIDMVRVSRNYNWISGYPWFWILMTRLYWRQP